MIRYTFTTYAFPVAWLIAAVAYSLILTYLTLHIEKLLINTLLVRCIPLELAYYCLSDIGDMVAYLFKVAYYIKKDYA